MVLVMVGAYEVTRGVAIAAGACESTFGAARETTRGTCEGTCEGRETQKHVQE